MKNNKLGQAVMSPAMIMGIVVTLIILGVGTYAFFTVTAAIPTTTAPATHMINNITGTADQVFNILGVVIIIGSIMLIVSMVYSYMRPE